MKERAATIYDISEKAGVSIATVSRVLNGSANVSASTREKVLEAIAESGYTPNAFARGLGLNTMKTIGVLTADSSDLYLAKGIYLLERQLHARGYDVLLACTGYSLEGRQSSVELLLGKKVDGIILIGSHFVYETEEENRYIREAARSVPVMILNGILEAENVYCFASDDIQNTYEAATELLRSGREKILYFYNAVSYSGMRKLTGYRNAMRDAGKKPEEWQVRYFDGSGEDVPGMAASLREVWEAGHRFDACLAADDTLALSAVKFAREEHLRVPEEFSVIGYNNSMLAAACEPELTSIDNTLEELCEKLTEALMRVLEGSADAVPGVTRTRGRLVRRGTA